MAVKALRTPFLELKSYGGSENFVEMNKSWESAKTQTSNSNESLQAAFKKFRKKKQDKLKQAMLMEERALRCRADPIKMADLRKKFVEQAKSYIGVPYAKRYHGPDSPYYDAPLFLDCCGLTRRTLRDLKEDFGFYVGSWNQAYQFDTLPITLESVDDMKPGDLVFVSGIYHNPKAKKQRHNMVHVEIWLGDGEKTLGARWQRKTLAVHDSYQYESKSYHSMKYHFKSIDTWLMGICKSYCPEHVWKESQYQPGKNSIFALDDDQEQDQAAEDDGEDYTTQSESTERSHDICDPYIKSSTSMASPPEVNSEDISDSHGNSDVRVKEIDDADEISATASDESGCCSHIGVNKNGTTLTSNQSSERTIEMFSGCHDNEKNCNRLSEREGTQSDNKSNISIQGAGSQVLLIECEICASRENVESENIERHCIHSHSDHCIDQVFHRTTSLECLHYNNLSNEHRSEHSSSCSDVTCSVVEERCLQPYACATSDSSGLCDRVASSKEASSIPSYEDDSFSAVLDRVASSERGSNLPSYQTSSLTRTINIVASSEGISCESDLISLHTNRVTSSDGSSCKTDALAMLSDRVASSEGAFCEIGPLAMLSDKVSSSEGSSHKTVELALPSDRVASSEGASCKTDSLATPSDRVASSEGDSCKTDSLAMSSDRVASSEGATCKTDSLTMPSDRVASSAGPSQPIARITEKFSELTVHVDSSGARTCYVSCPTGGSTDSNKSGKKSVTPSKSSKTVGVASRRGANGGGDDNNENNGQSSPRKKPPLYSRSRSTTASSEPTFVIGGHNGASMVESTLTSMGWTKLEDKQDHSFKMKWVECKSHIKYSEFKEGEQLVNHIPNGNLLTTKIGLMTTLKDYERLQNKVKVSRSTQTTTESEEKPPFQLEFLPETYKLDSPVEKQTFIENIYKEGETWICKPTGMNQGKGIFLVRNLDELTSKLQPDGGENGSPRRRMSMSRPAPGRIIQRYISNPLLLDGCKFDIRVYMLIASTVPYVVLYHHGYVRLSCIPYSLDADVHAHLTNQYIQKKHPLYSTVKENTVWNFQQLQDYIDKHHTEEKGLAENWIFTTFTKRMQQIMMTCFKSVQNRLERKAGFFDLLGFDFMVDEDFKVWLLEINVNPALHTNCQVLKDVIPATVDETLRIVVEIFDKKQKKKPVFPLENLKDYQILFKEGK